MCVYYFISLCFIFSEIGMHRHVNLYIIIFFSRHIVHFLTTGKARVGIERLWANIYTFRPNNIMYSYYATLFMCMHKHNAVLVRAATEKYYSLSVVV